MRAAMRSALLVVASAVLTNCGDSGPAPPSPRQGTVSARPARDRAATPDAPPLAPVRDPRLIDDCGPWTPPAATLDLVAPLGDPATKGAALKALEALPAADRIDALRAGLRLRDDAAAVACAARLTYKEIDGWECARCVDLLRGICLDMTSDGEFEEVRSYLGSAELDEFIDALPPLPWSYDVKSVPGQLHRILREDSFDSWMKLVRHTDERVREAAISDWSATVAPRCDARREDVARMSDPPGTAPPVADGPGLPPLLVREIRRGIDWHVEARKDETKNVGPPVDDWARRWLLASDPAPRDAAILIELAGLMDCGVVALGRTRTPEAIAWIMDAGENRDCAPGALALAGAEGAIERLAALSARLTADDGKPADDEEAMLHLAALMEADPARARRVIEERVFGEDDDLAWFTLSALEYILVPGAQQDAEGFRFGRTRLDGLAERVATARIPADRRAFAAVVLPGCRTRAAAERACAEMDDSFLRDGADGDMRMTNAALAFLETAAPESFRAAMRSRVGGAHRSLALEILSATGDPASGELLVAEAGDDPELLARSPCAAVVEHLTAVCRAGGDDGPWEPLLHALGAPRELRWVFPDDVLPRSRERLLAGDWRGAVLAALGEQPDDEHGDIGALRGEPAVAAYLQRLRARRDLGHYWYATGQLAAWGDPAARAEFWKAMTDGRYRIIDESDEFARTLGLDFAATMPHWIRELRSSCCRACNGAGDPWEDLFGIDGYETWQRTPADRAQSIWDASGGRFAWSWIAERFVIAAE